MLNKRSTQQMQEHRCITPGACNREERPPRAHLMHKGKWGLNALRDAFSGARPEPLQQIAFHFSSAVNQKRFYQNGPADYFMASLSGLCFVPSFVFCDIHFSNCFENFLRLLLLLLLLDT
jgi:hypothetical protein